MASIHYGEHSLSLKSSGMEHNFDASAAETTAALDELPNIGGLRVSVDEIGKITNNR